MDCVFRVPDPSLVTSSLDEPLRRSLCPTRAAARQAIHAHELWSLLAAETGGPNTKPADEVPLLPDLEGHTLESQPR